jgi:YbbR domain-containing protein
MGSLDQQEQRFPSVEVAGLDAAGVPLQDLRVEPAQVDVAVRVMRRGVEVAVVPDVIGVDAVADGYYFTGISVSPPFVQLDGPSDQVQAIREDGAIRTAPVDVSGLSGEVERRVRLQLPGEVTALNAEAGVTVTVSLEPLPGTVTREVTLTSTGLGSGLAVDSITPEILSVLVSGPQPLLEELEDGQIVAELDLSGLAAGAHRITPRIRLPANIQERSVTPNEVEVILSNAGTAAPTASPTRPR